MQQESSLNDVQRSVSGVQADAKSMQMYYFCGFENDTKILLKKQYQISAKTTNIEGLDKNESRLI